jgi:hypothetical protein
MNLYREKRTTLHIAELRAERARDKTDETFIILVAVGCIFYVVCSACEMICVKCRLYCILYTSLKEDMFRMKQSLSVFEF